jgi:hypothetical protein
VASKSKPAAGKDAQVLKQNGEFAKSHTRIVEWDRYPESLYQILSTTILTYISGWQHPP